jgi:hypothetical protein
MLAQSGSSPTKKQRVARRWLVGLTLFNENRDSSLVPAEIALSGRFERE